MRHGMAIFLITLLACVPVASAQTTVMLGAPIKTLEDCNLNVFVSQNAKGASVEEFYGGYAILIDPASRAGSDAADRLTRLCADWKNPAEDWAVQRETVTLALAELSDLVKTWLAREAELEDSAYDRNNPDSQIAKTSLDALRVDIRRAGWLREALEAQLVRASGTADALGTLRAKGHTIILTDPRGHTVDVPPPTNWGGLMLASNVLLPQESFLPAPSAPTGVVLLSQKTASKNELVCSSLLDKDETTVPSAASVAADKRNKTLVMHWPSTARPDRDGVCPSLLRLYDFQRAQDIRRSYGLADRPGPIFLGLDAVGEVVFLDLTNASNLEVYRSVKQWLKWSQAAPKSPQSVGLIKASQTLLADLFPVLKSERTVQTFSDPKSGLSKQFYLFQASGYQVGVTGMPK